MPPEASRWWNLVQEAEWDQRLCSTSMLMSKDIFKRWLLDTENSQKRSQNMGCNVSYEKEYGEKSFFNPSGNKDYVYSILNSIYNLMCYRV